MLDTTYIDNSSVKDLKKEYKETANVEIEKPDFVLAIVVPLDYDLESLEKVIAKKYVDNIQVIQCNSKDVAILKANSKFIMFLNTGDKLNIKGLKELFETIDNDEYNRIHWFRFGKLDESSIYCKVYHVNTLRKYDITFKEDSIKKDYNRDVYFYTRYNFIVCDLMMRFNLKKNAIYDSKTNIATTTKAELTAENFVENIKVKLEASLNYKMDDPRLRKAADPKEINMMFFQRIGNDMRDYFRVLKDDEKSKYKKANLKAYCTLLYIFHAYLGVPYEGFGWSKNDIKSETFELTVQVCESINYDIAPALIEDLMPKGSKYAFAKPAMTPEQAQQMEMQRQAMLQQQGMRR